MTLNSVTTNDRRCALSLYATYNKKCSISLMILEYAIVSAVGGAYRRHIILHIVLSV